MLFGGDAAFGPKNIIWAVAHGHDAAVSIDRLCHGEDITVRPPPRLNLTSQKMGIHEWSYDNQVSEEARKKVPVKSLEKTLKDIKLELVITSYSIHYTKLYDLPRSGGASFRLLRWLLVCFQPWAVPFPEGG